MSEFPLTFGVRPSAYELLELVGVRGLKRAPHGHIQIIPASDAQGLIWGLCTN